MTSLRLGSRGGSSAAGPQEAHGKSGVQKSGAYRGKGQRALTGGRPRGSPQDSGHPANQCVCLGRQNPWTVDAVGTVIPDSWIIQLYPPAGAPDFSSPGLGSLWEDGLLRMPLLFQPLPFHLFTSAESATPSWVRATGRSVACPPFRAEFLRRAESPKRLGLLTAEFHCPGESR